MLKNQNKTIRLVGRIVTSIGLMCLLAGCGGTPRVPADNAATDDQSQTYLIGPGDQLQVFVWRQPELSVEVPVRPDGRISTPLVDDMLAVGNTPTELARKIETVLAEFIRAPQVSIIVRDFVGAFSDQIRVIGQAAEPQAIAYRDQITVLDVVIEAGGLTEFAAGNRSRIVRNENGRRVEIRVRLNDLVKKGQFEKNVLMKPGDVLIIPNTWF